MLFVVYRLKEKISLLDLDYSHRTMFMWGRTLWAFFFSVPRPCFQHYFLGYKSLSELGCFRRRTFESIWSYGGPSKNSHILNVSLQNTMGSHAPFFYHAHFRSNEAGIGITRGTVSLSEISALIVWYHGTNLSGQHTMVSFQKQWKMGKVCSWVCSCEFSK